MNEIIKPTESIERERKMVSEWVGKFSIEQKVGEISSDLLRKVLESYGANFENLSDDAKKSLSKYSEMDRGFGARSVWGNKFVNDYKKKVGDFIKDYEYKTGIELPELVNKKNPDESTRRKNSGMVQFLFDLTSFASGEYSFERFKTYVEGRINNGICWEEGRKKDRIKISIPTDEHTEGEDKLLSSFPRGFPDKAWGWITESGLK